MSAPYKFDLETEVRDLFEAKMREFATFCAEQWLMTKEQAECLTEPSQAPSEYARGYNAAMSDGFNGALEYWLDETEYGR